MIVYTPVDLKCSVPNYSDLLEYVEQHFITNLPSTLGYTSKLCPLAAHYPVKNWRDANDVFRNNGTGYSLEKNPALYFAPDVTKKFPELFNILFSLPYKQIYGVGLNLHTNPLPAHRDEIDLTGAMSPERYNVLLSPHYEMDSFFIATDTKESKKVYPKILEEYPVYAFNNKDVYHGADVVLNGRIILICDGILDHEKHRELIERSSKKFDEYVIRFDI